MTDEMELSEREIEIIRLVATGASNKEIANKLIISPNTVKVHLRNIFSKMGVLSRTEATMKAIKMGLVESPGSIIQFQETESLNSIKEPIWEFEQELPPNKNQKNQKRLLVVGIGILLLVSTIFFIFRDNFPSAAITGTISPETIEVLNSNRWSSLTSLPVGVSEMGFVRYENKFLLFGGEKESGVSNQLLIYEIDTEIWSVGPDIPVGLKDIQAAILGEKIYIPGGVNDNGKVVSSLFVYNPREKTWETGKSLPEPLSGYAMVPYEGKLYLFGGFNGGQYLSSIYMYDPVVNDWVLYGKADDERAYMSAVVLGGQIHLFGGKNEREIFDDHLIYYPQRELLGEEAWVSAADLPDARYGMNSTVLADMIYTVGGNAKGSDKLPIIQYLPPKDIWIEIESPPVDIGFSPAVLPYETRLFVLGGKSSDGISSQNFAYQAVYTILVPVVR